MRIKLGMKINTCITRNLKPSFYKRISDYRENLQHGNLKDAWEHLERTHILEQAFPWEHTYVHWKMLLFGIKIKSTREVIGQIPRLLVGGVKSFVGKIPVGNAGGANVPPLKPLPIDKEILEIFTKAGLHHYGS